MKITIKYGLNFKDYFDNTKDAIAFINTFAKVWSKDEAIAKVMSGAKVIQMLSQEETKTKPFYLRGKIMRNVIGEFFKHDYIKAKTPISYLNEGSRLWGMLELDYYQNTLSAVNFDTDTIIINCMYEEIISQEYLLFSTLHNIRTGKNPNISDRLLRSTQLSELTEGDLFAYALLTFEGKSDEIPDNVKRILGADNDIKEMMDMYLQIIKQKTE